MLIVSHVERVYELLQVSIAIFCNPHSKRIRIEVLVLFHSRVQLRDAFELMAICDHQLAVTVVLAKLVEFSADAVHRFDVLAGEILVDSRNTDLVKFLHVLFVLLTGQTILVLRSSALL